MPNLITVTVGGSFLGTAKKKKISINADDIKTIEHLTKDKRGKSKIIMKGLIHDDYYVQESLKNLEKIINTKGEAKK